MILELPMTCPQHEASPDEERVALKLQGVDDFRLATLSGAYVVTTEDVEAICVRGTLSEIEAWADEALEFNGRHQAVA